MQISKLQFKIQNFLKYNKGFSLIEILVAVSIFAVAATISVGALISLTDAQQKILALRVVQDNLSYALDTMGKEIRTVSSYHCGADINDFLATPRDCSTFPGGPSFTFINNVGDKITYRFNDNRIERVLNGNPANALVMTASDAVITSLSFYVVGSPGGFLCGGVTIPSDQLQPRVTVILKGAAGIKEKIKSHINIQTTISQRLLDS